MKFSKSLLVAFIAAILAGCNQEEAKVEVSSVSLNTATIQMVEGETFNLVATVLPKDAEYDCVIWASSNASVASVNYGMVTALKEGTATITASAGGKSSTCSVKVSAKVIPVTSIALDKTSLSMQVGDTETLTATVSPADATDMTVTWGSSDVSIAIVVDGKITAKKSGTATISAKSGNCTAECAVAVSVNTESVTLDKTTLSLAVGETAILTATVKPDDVADKKVSWTSSDETVAMVSDGKVTAVKSGKATIIAECGGKSAECSVTVTVPVASISLDKSSLSLAVGETAILTATVKPDDVADKKVSWTSSDESVAKVADGKVTAVKAGSAIIKAECGDKFAECVVGIISPDRMITYTTRDGRVVSINNENGFGATIVSNEYVDGSGRIVFDGPVTSVGKAAFMGCTNITSMKLPDTVTRIGVGAFKGCSNLKSINTPNSLSAIDAEAFSDCSNLSFFSLPEGISKIEDNTFYMCNSLVIDKIPSSVTAIGNGAFVWNYALEKLVLPYGVVSVGESAFWGSGIKELELPNSLTSVGHWGFSDIKVEKLTIPGSLKTIKASVFSSDCLSEIIVEEGIITIEKDAFSNNEKLKKVVLPSTLMALFKGVFDKCLSFSDLYIKADTPPGTYYGAFNSIYGHTDSVFGDEIDFNIWVPSSVVDVYKKDWYWKKYKDHIKGYDF